MIKKIILHAIVTIIFVTYPNQTFAVSPDYFPSNFEVSGWIELGIARGLRGYWYDLTFPYEKPPTSLEIGNAKKIITQNNHNVLYITTHHQFTLEDTKKTFLSWKNQSTPGLISPPLVPAIVLQNYAHNIESCNYTDQELDELLAWLHDNINSHAIAIYDVYSAQQLPNRKNFCNQLPIFEKHYGGKEIIRLAIQPDETVKPPFTRAVQDTHWSVSSGENASSWENACRIDPSTNSAKNSLIKYVKSRLDQNARVAWDLIIVGFDYSVNKPCGAEGYHLDNPVPVGRNRQAHDTILQQYINGAANPLWGGYSFDYKIINEHTLFTDPAGNSLYDFLKRGEHYNGYFSSALKEAVEINSLYNDNTTKIDYFFHDVPKTHPHYKYIEQLRLEGIIAGCASNPNRFCPDSLILRQQVPYFLLRSKFGKDYSPPIPTNQRFIDVPPTHPAYAWIDSFAQNGITAGCGENKYCPLSPVSRAAFSILLLKAKFGRFYVPQQATGIFEDVPQSHPQIDWIEDIYRKGISTGCANNKFCPEVLVTRGMAATLVSKTFELEDIPQYKEGDFNKDGRVDIEDYNLLITNFGNPYTIFDYNILVENYNK